MPWWPGGTWSRSWPGSPTTSPPAPTTSASKPSTPTGGAYRSNSGASSHRRSRRCPAAPSDRGLPMRVRAAAVAPSVAVLSMVVFGSFGSAGAAAAARAALTPAAGLLDGQSVVVSGAGFDPDVQVGMAECLTGTVGTAECDPAGVHFTTTDGSGSFSTPVRVTRVINVAG